MLALRFIFIIEADGLRVCHLGDLGHDLDPGQVEKIGLVDILFIPVGGFYTIGAGEALNVMKQLRPKYTVPMHYKTDYIDFPISPPEEFLNHFPAYRVEQKLVVQSGEMPAATQVVLLGLKSL